MNLTTRPREGLKNYLYEIAVKMIDTQFRSSQKKLPCQVLSDSQACEIIDSLQRYSKQHFSIFLKTEQLNYGASQKIVSLMLKYLWCLDLIEEPPICPLDRHILSKITKEISCEDSELREIKGFKNWTQIENKEIYIKIINSAKISFGDQIAKWELENWEGNTPIKSNVE